MIYVVCLTVPPVPAAIIFSRIYSQCRKSNMILMLMNFTENSHIAAKSFIIWCIWRVTQSFYIRLRCSRVFTFASNVHSLSSLSGVHSYISNASHPFPCGGLNARPCVSLSPSSILFRKLSATVWVQLLLCAPFSVPWTAEFVMLSYSIVCKMMLVLLHAFCVLVNTNNNIKYHLS